MTITNLWHKNRIFLHLPKRTKEWVDRTNLWSQWIMVDNCWFILTRKICSDKLLYRTDKLNHIPVEVTPHRTLNYSRCVIWCKELAGMNEEDIQKELQSQGVTKVERMKRWKDGRLIPADSYILTINGQEIPKEIKVGSLIPNTKVYIPNPQRCFNCQKYGHNKRFYKNVQNTDSQVMRIMNVKMRQSVQIVMVIISHTTEFALSGKPRKKSSK